jgi:hypothetical protein
MEASTQRRELAFAELDKNRAQSIPNPQRNTQPLQLASITRNSISVLSRHKSAANHSTPRSRKTTFKNRLPRARKAYRRLADAVQTCRSRAQPQGDWSTALSPDAGPNSPTRPLHPTRPFPPCCPSPATASIRSPQTARHSRIRLPHRNNALPRRQNERSLTRFFLTSRPASRYNAIGHPIELGAGSGGSRRNQKTRRLATKNARRLVVSLVSASLARHRLRQACGPLHARCESTGSHRLSGCGRVTRSLRLTDFDAQRSAHAGHPL